jgi:hypothetical protein
MVREIPGHRQIKRRPPQRLKNLPAAYGIFPRSVFFYTFYILFYLTPVLIKPVFFLKEPV